MISWNIREYIHAQLVTLQDGTRRKMKILLGIVSLMMACISSSGSNDFPASYIVLAPKTVRPGLKFTLSVHIRNATGPVNLTAKIQEENEGITEIVAAQDTFIAGELATLDLQIPDTLSTPRSQYQLVVDALGGGIDFTESQDLQFDVTHFAIFIQTDKAIYKPGQTVHFRILGVYPGMLPYTGPFRVEVTDPESNIIQLWPELQNETYGVITQSMIMSSEPVLGDWIIKATAEGQEKTHTVTIDEYVLPKFEVEVVLPPYLTAEDHQLNIQINSKYTYGKPLKGTADVVIQFNYYTESIQRNVQIDGTADVAVTLDDMLKLYKSFKSWSDGIDDGQVIIVSATVKEELTGLVQETSSKVTYHEKPIKVDALPITSEVYKPGLTYIAFFVVTHQDGSMLTALERRNSLMVAFQLDGSSYWIRLAYSIPETGVVEARYVVPVGTTSLQVKAFYYRPSSSEIGGYVPNSYSNYLTRMDSPSQTYLQISLETVKVSVGEDMALSIKTTEIPPKITYMVISQGNIVLFDALNDPTSDTNTVTITIDSSMTPKARVIVSFVRDDGEVIMDYVELQVDGTFKNQVTVSFDKDTSEPGDNITFSIEASPQSLVGILAVDQSVLILKSGNDITQAQVIDALSAIDTTSNSRDQPTGGIVFRKKRSSYWVPRYSPGSSVKEIVVDAGLLVFTDALIYGDVNQYPYSYAYDDAVLEMAGNNMYAMDASSNKVAVSGNGPDASKITVRKQFPETWLWSDLLADSNGRVTVKTMVPDTITSWLGSAFAVSLSDGFGVTEEPAKTTVFKPFFVSLNLPYSIVRGEILVLQATVFNYFDKEVSATVSLKKSSYFEAIFVDENGLEKTSSKDMVDKVTVPAGSGVSVFFPIKIIKIGLVDLEVRAICTNRAGDAVRRQLLVEAEGVAHSISENRLFNEKTNTDINEVFNIGLPSPDQLVDGSVHILLSITGDIMGPTMNNLDSLLKMPYGCGEQNMMNFAPDVFVYEYLTVTEQSSESIKGKAYTFMLSGYQRELTYKHSDGSFSAFGERDPSGSVWLTAFVVKSFSGAVQFITIDRNVIERAVSFIIKQQNKKTGNYREPGRIVDRGIEGGVNPGATLTAYITIALQEVFNSPNTSETVRNDIRSAISRAQTYLEAEFDSVSSDPYELSLVCYALAVSKSSSASRFRQALDEMAITKGGQRHWSTNDEETDTEDYWYKSYHGPASSDVETTAYALLTYLEMDDAAGAASIAKWLTHQRNAFGGYGSTQDTVVGLQALTKFALVFREADPQVDLAVSLSSDPSYSRDLSINNDNSIVLQQLELPAQSGDVVIRGSGRGTCLMTVAVSYHLMAVSDRKPFIYTIRITDVDNNNLEIEACGRYAGDAKVTSMCLMDIGIPSGFAADHDHLTNLVDTHPLLQKFEAVQQSVYLYFQEIPKDEMSCVTIFASRSNVVANVQPRYSRLYDYYNPSEQVIVEYSSDALHSSTICDVCPACAGCNGGAKQPLVSLILLAITVIIAVFISTV